MRINPEREIIYKCSIRKKQAIIKYKSTIFLNLLP